jgi:acetylornithine/N-succinyldiaminopimelate aminotransferase
MSGPSSAVASPASALLPTFARLDIGFERGEGCWLYDQKGEAYLDFGSGIAVNALGHAHPHLVEALQAQAAKLWHVSNLYQIPEGERLARRLVEHSFADTVFFTNSGAEALECAIKMARKYHSANGHPEKFRIITFEGAFHGRTLATLAAGGQKKYLDGFGPKVDGFDQVAFADHDAIEKVITPETAAILIEPIQGEGGVRVVPSQCLKGLRELCDRHGLLLIFDEVQCGMGRTGHLFAYQKSGVAPDIMALAKGLGGGFPVGACLSTLDAGKGMTAGSHGTTFGGNPLAMAVGNAVLDVMLAPGFLDHVRHMGLLFKQKLAALKDRHPRVIADVRGEGLLMGVKAAQPNTELTKALFNEHMLSVGAGDNVVRLLPPLIIDEKLADDALHRLDAACARIEAEHGFTATGSAA